MTCRSPFRAPLLVLAAAALAAGCDSVGGENARGAATPDVAPPRLSPVEIHPPRVDPAIAARVLIRDPPRIDATQVDVHKQSDGIVDILWVIDNSGSMKNERTKLQGHFERFLQELLTLKVDFQMGVISTDANDGARLRGTTRIIKNTTPDVRAAFLANTEFPDSRIRWSQGLRMAQLAVSPPLISTGGHNSGFVRPNAALAMIVVSDTDDSSYGDPAYYARAFRAIRGKGNENLVSFSTIAGTTPSGCYGPGQQIYFGGLADPAFRYSAVSSKTGGVVGSICDVSFEDTLVRIAQALNTLRRVFPLSIKPTLESISVTVNGVPIPRDVVNGWQYRPETQSIAFLGNYVPPPGAEIRISYAFSRNPDGGSP
ncbi:MAG: vWA domain-containing protein [Myxococcaceae bacterium]